MESQTVVVIGFSAVIIMIALVVIVFLFLARRLEKDYVEHVKNEYLMEAMDKDTIFEKMVRGGRVLQYITILGAFAAVFFLAILGVITGELAGAIIGMIITGVIGAEAGARAPGEIRRELKRAREEKSSSTEPDQ